MIKASPLRLLIVSGAAASALTLGGCISLFPKSDPATLYTLVGRSSAPPPAPAVGPTINVMAGRTLFPRAAASDRILTTTGTEAAYIANSRWTAPAPLLFDEALAKGFDDAAPALRLLNRGEAARPDLMLRIELRSFEAQYRSGPDAPPTVVVEAVASLTRMRDRMPLVDKRFKIEKPAADNRVGPIVDAYDEAVGDLVGGVVAFTAEQGRAAPR